MSSPWRVHGVKGRALDSTWDISIQKVGREREAHKRDQEVMSQALEDDKDKVGPGKSRHISRRAGVIGVDCREVKQIIDWKESPGFSKYKDLSMGTVRTSVEDW